MLLLGLAMSDCIDSSQSHIAALEAERDLLRGQLDAADEDLDALERRYELDRAECGRLREQLDAARQALDLVDAPYPLDVFPERTPEQRDAIFAAMRAVDKYATEWFYAHVARQVLEDIVAESSHTMILTGTSLARARAVLGAAAVVREQEA